MRPPTHSVLVVDDHPIVRQGVHRLIAGEERFVVCGEASSWAEAVEATAAHLPDAVILDISLGAEKPLNHVFRNGLRSNCGTVFALTAVLLLVKTGKTHEAEAFVCHHSARLFSD